MYIYDEDCGRAAMAMDFTRSPNSSPTPHLFVANCGPAVGLSASTILQAFAAFGSVRSVQLADETASRVIVSFSDLSSAVAAREAWNHLPCSLLGNRVLHIQYSVPLLPPQVEDPFPVSKTAEELQVPGLYLYTDFISEDEEQELLAEVDARPWHNLSKRRVQHYGYEFNYKTRNVDTTHKIGELPLFVRPILGKLMELKEPNQKDFLPPDQLTVNEYPSGVGLSPHVDTHSAFEGVIFSLSLAGSCIMEFRKYRSVSETVIDDAIHGDAEGAIRNMEKNGHVLYVNDKQEPTMRPGIKRWLFERKSIFLPQRSLLVLSKDARYEWQHYIPHHKVDFVEGERIERISRRVSFTFRKVRLGACNCEFQQYCDSQTLKNPFDQIIMETLYGERSCIEAANARGDVDCQLDFSDVDHSTHQNLNVDTNTVLSLERSLEEKISYERCTESAVAYDDNRSLFTEIEVPESGQSKEADGLSERKSIDTTPEIERKYVHGVYDAIAPHFSSTRFAKWPRVASFLDSLPPGSIVVDAGCGNGKYLGLNPMCLFIGCDISPSLVSICAQKSYEVHVADTLCLPYRTGCYDAAISIAVLHHLSTEERRRKAVAELLRVIRKGGKILITVWAVEQEDSSLLTKWTPLTGKYMEEWVDDLSSKVSKISSFVPLERIKERDSSFEEVKQKTNENQREQQEYFVPWHLPYHRPEVAAASSTAISSGLARIDDEKGAIIYNRYYHVFVRGELERLVSSVNGVCIAEHFYDKSNWCVVIEKL